ncbi:MAG: hypothetical protein FJ398_19295 [Verrucomicrobia bacterium]|nr:hypothetical protein [Verrucomicrobiota bacterium]
MKNSLLAAAVVALSIVLLGLILMSRPAPDPKNLDYWSKAASGKDWFAAAAQGNAEAQFFLGLTSIRANLIKMVDRVPGAYRIPILGKRCFEKFSSLQSTHQQF